MNIDVNCTLIINILSRKVYRCTVDCTECMYCSLIISAKQEKRNTNELMLLLESSIFSILYVKNFLYSRSAMKVGNAKNVQFICKQDDPYIKAAAVT